MSKHWLGWVVVLVASWGWSKTAYAGLTGDPSIVAFGSVLVLTEAEEVTTISSDNPSGDELDRFTFSASCPALVITPSLPLPQTLFDEGATLELTISYTPQVRGAINPTCVVSMRNAAGTNLGSFNVTGRGVAPEIDAPASETFGSVRASSGTASQTITVQNDGDTGQTLNITSYTFGGMHPGDFTITNTPAMSLAPGAMTTVTIQFDPAATGPREATLLIASNDPLTPTESVDLTGTGTSAVIGVTDRDFGIVTLLTTSNSTITVSNTGVGTTQPPLHVTSASITGGGGWLTFDNNGGAGCGGQTTCTFSGGGFDVPPNTNIGVRCRPPAGAMGTMTATVAVTSNTDSGGDNISDLSCTAGRADIDVSPTSLAFGDRLVGTSSAPQTVTITNNGNQQLTYSTTKSGAQSAAYTIVGCVTNCNVAAGAQATFTVTFSPSAPADANITIAIASNDPDNATVNVAVTGRGIAPQISVPPTLEFNNVEVGKMSTLTLTATNTGLSTLTIASGALTSGTNDYTVLNGPPPMTMVPPSGTVSWDIMCNPSTHGARPGNFQIQSNSHVGSTANVVLTCNGQQGVLVTSITSHAFGGVVQGGNVPVTFTLRNSGNVTVSGITGVVDPANVGYSLDAGTPMTLTAGQTVSLTARFQPTPTADGGPADIDFAGTWGSTATPTTATIALTGDGLVGGFDVTPATVNFGNLRFDTTVTRTFCVINTDQAPVRIENNLSIVPAAGTMTGEFAVTTVRRQTTCGMGGTTVTLPQTLAPTEVVEVSVRADPANRVGPMMATITVTSNLPMNPTRTAMLVGTSTSANLAVAPGPVLDFGAVDVQGPAVTRDLTITNTGDGPLDLGNFQRGADPQFTLTLPPAQMLPPGGVLTIPVTYKPIVAAPAGSEERFNLTHSIAGVLNGPTAGTIMIQGRGIDRDIELGPTPQFPDTFRNPGDAAPVRPVSVRNMGEAVLKVSMVMITDDDASWSIVDPSPVDIPHLGSHDVLVRFSPTESVRSTAVLQIYNDDDTLMMAMVTLTGMGRDRSVTFGPNTIRLGYTGVGVPVTIPDALVVTSTDAATAYTIRSIDLEGGSPFAIEGTTEAIELAPQASRSFAVTFSPEAQGPFSAKVALYLDQDTKAHHEVTLEGEAVFVEARGGGGCSTSGAGAGGGALIALGLLALRQRRRRRAALAAIAVVGLAGAPAARADVVLSLFDPAPAVVSHGFQVQSAEVGAPGAWVASAVVSNATDPLLLDAGTSVARPVRRSTLFDLGLAYAFLDRFEVGARMPMYNQDGDPRGDPLEGPTTEPASGTARGDLTIHAKARLYRRALEGNGSFHLGATAGVTVPTATEGQFTGVDKPSVRALLLGSLTPGAFANRLTVSINAGGVVRATSSYANLEQKSGIAWGLGASVRALDRLWVAGEVFGDTMLGGHSDQMGTELALSPIEWLVGLRWRPDHRVAIGLAGGRGLTSAAGTPALRGVVSLSFTPGAAEIRPIPGTEPKPEGDADGDGIRDRSDRCPREAEDADLFDDADGCPDVDNDLDGIADDKDRCALEPEDKDGFEDGDGCLDKDNDSDGVVDAQDKCPTEAEDKDGSEDLDGCPDLDNDHDGIADDKDRCPSDPETINGTKDDDGCPDKGDGMVVVGPDRLETLAAIEFAGTKLARGSFNVLGQIAATLRAHPEILRVRVTAHVHPSQNTERDQDITDKRAQAVRDWLIQWGIAPGRVEARGFGGTRPISRGPKAAAALNERIELVILERK